jgi:hypothetical protein
VECQRKENLQRKSEVLRGRSVEVPLRPPKAWTYGRVSTKSYLRRHPAIIVEGIKKKYKHAKLKVRFKSPSAQTGKANISIHSFGYWFQLIILFS